MSNLTNNEITMLCMIATSEYCNNGSPPTMASECTPVWSNCLRGLPSTSIPGVISSLSKKGLVACYGRGKDATVELTSAGFDAWSANR